MSSAQRRRQTEDAGMFIREVLRLRPQGAFFDCDGTLWEGDSGEEFLYWELERGLLPRDVADWIAPRYVRYKEGKVTEEAICGEMVSIHAGLPLAQLQQEAEQFFAKEFVNRIFPEMADLVSRLARQGCEIWAVSSTNEWVVSAGVARFGIPPGRVLAACVHTEDGIATPRLRMVPTGEEKAAVIRRCCFKAAADPDCRENSETAAFGNSIHDLAMLEMAKYPFVVNPNSDLEQIAQKRDWRIYFPTRRKS